MTRKRPLADRLWAKVQKNGSIPASCPELGPCWPFEGSRTEKGYGKIGASDSKASPLTASRVAWTVTYGPIPPGMLVLHKCDNPPCCNPNHLFLGDYRANREDAVRKGRDNRTSRHRGDIHHEAKLTAAAVSEMRTLYRAGWTSPQLAERFGVAGQAVDYALTGKTWAHVQDVPPLASLKGPATLTADKVRSIRVMAACGVSIPDLAEAYGVTSNNIRYIVKRVTWKDVI